MGLSTSRAAYDAMGMMLESRVLDPVGDGPSQEEEALKALRLCHPAATINPEAPYMWTTDIQTISSGTRVLDYLPHYY